MCHLAVPQAVLRSSMEYQVRSSVEPHTPLVSSMEFQVALRSIVKRCQCHIMSAIYIIIRHCPGVGAFPRPFCVPNSVALASLTLQVGDWAIH